MERVRPLFFPVKTLTRHKTWRHRRMKHVEETKLRCIFPFGKTNFPFLATVINLLHRIFSWCCQLSARFSGQYPQQIRLLGKKSCPDVNITLVRPWAIISAIFKLNIGAGVKPTFLVTMLNFHHGNRLFFLATFLESAAKFRPVYY